ncbi:hypothetical protein RBH29_13495 [Herbivorax sp. ANBcel31]|uniref:hypothetical protein n=1 Tax=Herbivorax sp. ANBcel31 TaxID=3069754 RepID=UPI0027B3099F|nr:hypothetical protein [Herbivorax sp. ANBcel31]MDQ2087441.1 hypothetical protein [Herbivorax sp. ANBcel31]
MMIKFNTTFVSIIAIIIVFLTGFIKLNSTKNDWNFEFKTLYGDESVLEGITISGGMIDENLIVDFSMTKDKTKSSFEYFENYISFDSFNDINRYTTYHYRLRSLYHCENGKYYYRLLYNKSGGDPFYWGSASISKRIKIKKHNGYNKYTYVNSINIPIDDVTTEDIYMSYQNTNYIAEVNGRLFVVIPAKEKETVKHTICEVLDFNTNTYEEKIKINLDTEYNLEGIHSVNGRLCVVLTSGENLILKNYDLETMKCTDKYIAKSGVCRYVYIEDDIIIIGNADYVGRVDAFRINDEIEHLGYAEYEIDKIDNYFSGGKSNIRFINDKFYILMEHHKHTGVYIENEEGFRTFEYQVHDRRLRKKMLRLLVFDCFGNKLYYGQIESDIIDDVIRLEQLNERIIKESGVVVPYREYINIHAQPSEGEAKS